MPKSKNPRGQEQAIVSKTLANMAGTQVDVWIRGLSKKILKVTEREIENHIGARFGPHETLDILLAALFIRQSSSTRAFEISPKAKERFDDADKLQNVAVTLEEALDAVLGDLTQNRIQVLLSKMLSQIEADAASTQDEEFDEFE